MEDMSEKEKAKLRVMFSECNEISSEALEKIDIVEEKNETDSRN